MNTNQKPYNIALAKKLLKEGSNIWHVKYITGLSILSMVRLNLIEFYYPFTKFIPHPDPKTIEETSKGLEVINTDIQWLRLKLYA